MVEQNIKVKVKVENNIVVDKTEEKKLCKILVSKGDKGQDGNVSFDELTEEQKAQLKGEDGKGIPEGGSVGQILAKTSDDDYDAEWIDNNAEVDLTEYAKKEELPTKMSELENDKFFIENNKSFISVYGRLHIYNSYYSYSDRVDLSVGNLYGAESGGSIGTLYLNPYSNKNVSILHNGKEGGKLLYKNKEVATQEYVDEQIANIEVNGGNIDLSDYALKEELPTKVSDLENDSEYMTSTQLEEKKYATQEYVEEQISNIESTGGTDYELPIASSSTLGGIKVGANLTIDEDGTLNATSSGSGGSDYELPIASATTLGGVKIGDNLSIDENGVLSANSSGSSLDIFSTEEQVIGTWIDGKTIYRRVVEFTFSSTQNAWNLVASQTFTSLLKCCGFFKDTTVFMNFPVTSGNEILAVYGNGTTGVYEKHNYSYPNGKIGYLIIEYTK